MLPSDSADQADFHEPKPSGTNRRVVRDRHGRRDKVVHNKRTGPRYTLGPPKTVPMTADEYAKAVRALAVLIAAWWTDNPPDEETE